VEQHAASAFATREQFIECSLMLGTGRFWEKSCANQNLPLILTAMTDMNRTLASPAGSPAGHLAASCRAAQTVPSPFSFRKAGVHDSVRPGFFLIRLRQQHRMTKPVIARRFVTQP
jgi:hypothetical protein